MTRIIIITLTLALSAPVSFAVAADRVVIKALTPSSGGSAESGLHERMLENQKNPPVQTAITTAPLPPLHRKVSVLIESNPSNSDITIDGVYVGSTPVQLSLKEGVHHVAISREGYLSWSRAVKAYNGLMVSPTLVSGRSIKQDETVSAESK